MLFLFRHEHLHGVRGGVAGRLGVPHVQSHRQLPSMALLLLLHNAHFLPGVARQGDLSRGAFGSWSGKTDLTIYNSLRGLHCVCKCAYIFFWFPRTSSLRSSSRRSPRLGCNFNRCGGQGAAPPRPLQLRYSGHNRTKVERLCKSVTICSTLLFLRWSCNREKIDSGGYWMCGLIR